MEDSVPIDDARFAVVEGKGYGDSIHSKVLLPKERIMKSFLALKEKYEINTEDGLRLYISDMLEQAS